MPENIARPKYYQVGAMKVEVHSSAKAAGVAAARAAAEALTQLGKIQDTVGVVFATGASQMEFLNALTAIENLPWNRICGFHMDEYVGMPADHPASFRRYLRERLISKVAFRKFFEIDGTATDPEHACRQYAETLRAAQPQLCCLGIGENGHLAFNDPPVADFEDPLDMKIAQLDDACRQQQAAEGWFESMEQVPKFAMTLTIPALFRIPKLILSVPGGRKAKIVKRAFEDPISTKCPATILRTHPNATVYLDLESAGELDEVLGSESAPEIGMVSSLDLCEEQSVFNGSGRDRH